MERGLHFVCKSVEGEIQNNDGEFAEIQTDGIEGIEKDLLLGIMQIHRENTDDTKSQFEHRFQLVCGWIFSRLPRFLLSLIHGIPKNWPKGPRAALPILPPMIP